MREAKKTDFVGKTIKKIDLRAANCWTITFFDDSQLEIWTEIGNSIGIPYLYVEDVEKKTQKVA